MAMNHDEWIQSWMTTERSRKRGGQEKLREMEK